MTASLADLAAASPEPFEPEAALLEILETWAVHVPDETDFVFVSAVHTGLVDALLDWAKRSTS